MEHLDDTWADAAVASGMAALDLRQLGETSFEGDSLPMPGGRVFGGQVLAQALIAAGRTVDPRRDRSLAARLLPARGRCVAAHHASRWRASRRPLVLRSPHPRLPGRQAAAVDDRLVPGGAGRPRAPGRRCRRCRRPTPCRPASTCSAPFEGHPTADFWLHSAPFDVRHVEGSLFLAARPPAEGVPNRLDAGASAHRRRRAHAPRAARVRLRSGDARAAAAPARRVVGHARHVVREPRPRDVVAPSRARGRVAALCAGRAHRSRRARAHRHVDLRRGRRLVASASQEGMLRLP